MSGVDVVIVAHDAGALLQPAVSSAASQVGGERVVVVDAESTDGSVEAVRAALPAVRVIRAPNSGFAASNNVGIAATDGEFVLLLNPDAELAPGAIASLVARAQCDPRIGIVAPRVTDSDGSIQAGSYGRFPTLARVAAQRLRVLFGSRLEDVAVPTDVDWVTGACMLVRRAAIADVGPMDEGFFLYYEDVEWCHRMHDRAWRVVIEPAAAVLHHLGKSGAGSARVSQAYRDSFYRYCDLYGLWGLALLARAGLALRATAGGRI